MSKVLSRSGLPSPFFFANLAQLLLLHFTGPDQQKKQMLQRVRGLGLQDLLSMQRWEVANSTADLMFVWAKATGHSKTWPVGSKSLRLATPGHAYCTES